MATYIKTLKEDNGDIVYPQTNTDAVYTSGGETLETRISKYVTAEDVAQSVASFGTVTTGMLDDDAITTAKIDDAAVTTAKIDDDAVTTAKIDDGAITPAKINWSAFNVVIATTVNVNFFSGNYSVNFTAPKTGYYIIHDSWCGVFERISNSINTLDVKIDNTTVAKYIYASRSVDTEWGDSRRTITGQDILIYLTAGQHTLSTSGNLYYDASYYPKYHYISAEYFSD